MATIFAATSLELEPEKKKELIDALGETIGTIFKTYSLYYTPVPAENVSEGAKDQMTFFVFVPPYMEIDRRRQLIKVLNDTMVRVVGYKGPLKVSSTTTTRPAVWTACCARMPRPRLPLRKKAEVTAYGVHEDRSYRY